MTVPLPAGSSVFISVYQRFYSYAQRSMPVRETAVFSLLGQDIQLG